MPNAFPISGLQHICDNLTSDVHKSMSGFKDFYSELKNFEALLRTEERRCCFANPGKKKVVQVPVGSGGKLQPESIAVAILPEMRNVKHPLEGEDSQVISTIPAKATASDCPSFLLSSFSGDVARVKASVSKWGRQNLVWALPASHALQNGGATQSELSSLLTNMINTGNHENSPHCLGYTLRDGEEDAMGVLFSANIVRKFKCLADRWILREKGMRLLTPCSRLSDPTRFFCHPGWHRARRLHFV